MATDLFIAQMKQVYELVDTMDEAFRYLQASYRNFSYDATDALYDDLAAAFMRIAELLEQDDEQLRQLQQQFIVVHEQYIATLSGQHQFVHEQVYRMVEQVLPQFRQWKAALEAYVRSTILH